MTTREPEQCGTPEEREQNLRAGLDVKQEQKPDPYAHCTRIMPGLYRWIRWGVHPGHFLTACLRNKLSEAVWRADDEHLGALPEIVRFLYNHTPSGCWGSDIKVDNWQPLMFEQCEQFAKFHPWMRLFVEAERTGAFTA